MCGRGVKAPDELLKPFKGFLQTDGYAVYNKIAKTRADKDIILVNCLAHARRKFSDALDSDRKRAEIAMLKFQQVYEVEREVRENNLNAEQRKNLRLEKSLPILNELSERISKTAYECTPKSTLGKACLYGIKHWDNLLAYLHNGDLEIDNNLAENAIRPIALGRKNYLFAGSHKGAQRAAMMYSFFATCKKNNVNPYKWLNKVLEVIPTYKVSKLADLLPGTLKLD